ncbi:hypothetical protein KZX46_18135 [Polymorphobacter sp. PAMC 29334]|uniref:hypothetical protein n=1 Tax=Polymorphobacter sp. PAMC 29334 TaxID=2862331 RepID=UPI001C77D10A|nr:hypothetical protein [Polymorphobacter sp. PAMC 29334]QYE34656.1 hypothetical protein KZX46_18135 [Polymorphobacter sp. PAMC 29334]
MIEIIQTAPPVTSSLSLAYWTAGAVVISAVIGALIALFGHLINRSNTKLQNDIVRDNMHLSLTQDRENSRLEAQLATAIKLADMRQVWINNLRDDMSAFQSFGVTPDLDHGNNQEFYRLGTRIELFMNPDDPDYEALTDVLYGFLSAKSTFEKYSANPRFVKVCQRILKREWDVLKNELRLIEKADTLQVVDTSEPTISLQQ